MKEQSAVVAGKVEAVAKEVNLLKLQMQSAGQQPLSTRALAEIYRDELSTTSAIRQACNAASAN